MEKYTLNPNFKGTKEEARRQIEEFEEVTKWLEEHPGCIDYDDAIDGYVITTEAPECVIKHIKELNEAERKRRERVLLLKEKGILE
jgi:hypothetical protein